ncbi:hypothetical protein HYH02_007045 [Chlamydomonas schloesseri]|uniref:Uncharacterized protein n=1 Tax=Chlamydomonas schloesseri TaxID=2026947 RepID=A0A835WI87_9CHLO|nr:hypothetical protein HYH02_007045 [Chlamydomonas schloesseri]|eukprot:KAG2448017.1 hypothetical protein HYH02_007045 [Chlamydomonas schloesseri]
MRVLLLLDASTWTKEASATAVNEVVMDRGETAAADTGPRVAKKQRLSAVSPPANVQRVSGSASGGKIAPPKGDNAAAAMTDAKVRANGIQLELPTPRPQLHKVPAAFELLAQKLQRTGQAVRLHRNYQYGIPPTLLSCTAAAGVQQAPPAKTDGPLTYVALAASAWAFSADGKAVELTAAAPERRPAQEPQQSPPQSPPQPSEPGLEPAVSGQQQQQQAGMGAVGARVGVWPPNAGSANRRPPLLLTAVSIEGLQPTPVDATISLYSKNQKLVLRWLRDIMGGHNLPDRSCILHAYTLYRTQPHGHVLLVVDICRGVPTQAAAEVGCSSGGGSIGHSPAPDDGSSPFGCERKTELGAAVFSRLVVPKEIHIAFYRRMEPQPRKRARFEAAAAVWEPGNPNPTNGQPTFRPPVALGAPAVAISKRGEAVSMKGRTRPRLSKDVWRAYFDSMSKDRKVMAVPRGAWAFSKSSGILPAAPAAAAAAAAARPSTQAADGAGEKQLYIALSIDGKTPTAVDGTLVDQGDEIGQHVWMMDLGESLGPSVPAGLLRATLHAISIYTPAPGQVLLLLDVSTWSKEAPALASKKKDTDNDPGASAQREAGRPLRKKQKLATEPAPTKHTKRRAKAGKAATTSVATIKAKGLNKELQLPHPRPLHMPLAALQLPHLEQVFKAKNGLEVQLHKVYQYSFEQKLLDVLETAGVQKTAPVKPDTPYTYVMQSPESWAFTADGKAVEFKAGQDLPASMAAAGTVVRPAARSGGSSTTAASPALLLGAVSIGGKELIPVDATISLYDKAKVVLPQLKKILGEHNLLECSSLLHAFTLYHTKPHGHVLLVVDIAPVTAAVMAGGGGGSSAGPTSPISISKSGSTGLQDGEESAEGSGSAGTSGGNDSDADGLYEDLGNGKEGNDDDTDDGNGSGGDDDDSSAEKEDTKKYTAGVSAVKGSNSHGVMAAQQQQVLPKQPAADAHHSSAAMAPDTVPAAGAVAAPAVEAPMMTVGSTCDAAMAGKADSGVAAAWDDSRMAAAGAAATAADVPAVGVPCGSSGGHHNKVMEQTQVQNGGDSPPGIMLAGIRPTTTLPAGCSNQGLPSTGAAAASLQQGRPQAQPQSQNLGSAAAVPPSAPRSHPNTGPGTDPAAEAGDTAGGSNAAAGLLSNSVEGLTLRTKAAERDMYYKKWSTIKRQVLQLEEENTTLLAQKQAAEQMCKELTLQAQKASDELNDKQAEVSRLQKQLGEQAAELAEARQQVQAATEQRQQQNQLLATMQRLVQQSMLVGGGAVAGQMDQ